MSSETRHRTAAIAQPWRRGSAAPTDILLLHYTGMPGEERALDWLCDERSGVSSHYFVFEDGRIVQLVDEERRAWHAGVSFWAGETDINSRSIGIEIANPGHEFGYRAFPDGADRGGDCALPGHPRSATRSRRSACSPIPTWRRCGRKIRESCFRGRCSTPRASATGCRRPRMAKGETLRRGHRGAAVADLQREFRRYGYGLDGRCGIRPRDRGGGPRLPAPFPAGAGRRCRRSLDGARRSSGCASASPPRLDHRGRQCLCPRRQLAGRPLRQGSKGRRGGKSGLHGNTVPGNARRGRPQGKCHRKQTARPAQAGGVRVKGWGKSPPRARRRERHGKPHREQNRIGMARGFGPRPVSGPAIRVGCARRPATDVQDEWPSRGSNRRRTEPGLQANWHD